MNSGASSDVGPDDLVEALRVPAALVDSRGRVLAANDGFVECIGSRREDIVGEELDRALPGCPEEFVARVLDEGVTVAEHTLTEGVAAGPSQTIRLSGSPVAGEEGIRAVLIELEDMQGSQVERRDEATLAALVEGASDMVVRVGIDGTILWANAVALETLGYSEGELVGEPFDKIVPQRASAEIYALDHAIDDPPEDALASWRLTRDGEQIPVSVGIFPIFVEGDYVGTATVARDISDRVSAQRALTQANRALGRKAADLESFTYTVSHDLKSPLVTVTGFLGMAESQVRGGDTEGALASMARAGAAAERMGTMLEDLLRFSRLGGQRLNRQRLDVARIAEPLVIFFEPRLRECEARMEIGDGLPTVHADQALLTRALENLLANAVEHACQEPGRTIRVTGGRSDGSVWIGVEDDGDGIHPEDQERVLRLFERASQAGGSGMGLSIVQRIVGLHDGELRVESEGPGQGSRFVMSFPEVEE